MTTDEIKKRFPLERVIVLNGSTLVGQPPKLLTNACADINHKPRHLCVTVDTNKQLWHCNDCDRGGDVIRWIALRDRKTDAQVIKELGGNGTPRLESPPTTPEPKFETVCTYDYLNSTGDLAYQVVRQHAPAKEKPAGYIKTFRQRQPDSKGGWIYSMDGVERVLYRLPEVLKSKTVWIVEGEKDADTLAKLGFCATCNVGGAGKWMDGYTDTLSKKHVVICGDTDDAGKKHVKIVFDSLAGKAKTVRLINLPNPHKDVTDYIQSFKDQTAATHSLHSLADTAAPFVKGVSLPIYKVSELESAYQHHVSRLSQTSFDLSKWLPSLSPVRPLVPGELVLILGATGIGKTAALSNIALSAFPIPTLFFEMELPPELMFERLLALKTKISCIGVEKAYLSGDTLGEEAIDQKLSHIHICTQSRLVPAEIESLIIKSELKIGERPKLVLIDYIGLIHGIGKSRYERVSQVAEDLKVIAKVTQTVIVVASQVNRDATSESPEITLSSGKDSGSLENSSGLVLGMWRENKQTMQIKVLKATKGGAGLQVACNYNLDTLAITQRSPIDDSDIPNRKQPHNDP